MVSRSDKACKWAEVSQWEPEWVLVLVPELQWARELASVLG